MAARSEREKSKMQEKYQTILSQMLREEDNRLCVDCDARSPRWASWNIGVFICIRCAGFHRNLGVHISKVKSVNLDSWTGEQISAMQVMGNSRARAVYEANLPDGFRRPQSDSALEVFIRAKYEQRKWIAKEWIPAEITLIESETNQQQADAAPEPAPVQKSVSKVKPFIMPLAAKNPIQPSTRSVNSPTVDNRSQDLLKLEELTLSPTEQSPPSSNLLDPLHAVFAPASANKSEATVGLQDIDKDLESAFTATNSMTSSSNEVLSNEKIMALFNQPQTSVTTPPGINARPILNQLSHLGSPPSVQHSPFVPPQKSVSISGNLSQLHASSPLASAHAAKPSTHQFISQVPIHPAAAAATEYMPTPSDSLW